MIMGMGLWVVSIICVIVYLVDRVLDGHYNERSMTYGYTLWTI